MKVWMVFRSMAATAVLIVSTLIGPGAAAQTASCNGQRATIAGTPGPDQLIGTEGDDVIAGGGEDDVIEGRGGNDTICGDGGENVFNGGAGDDVLVARDDRFTSPDTATFEDSPGPVHVDLRHGTATGDGSDSLIGIQGVTGSAFGDVIIGSDESADYLRGGDGSDRIDSGLATEGIDLAHGGGGDDHLTGHSADFSGDAGNDVVVATIRGWPIAGGAGNDELRGTGEFIPGPGDDIIEGTEGDQDTISFLEATCPVFVDMASGIATGEGSDTFSLIDAIWASEHDDEILGSEGRDEMFGFGGNDILRGEAGDDVLLGGNGADIVEGGDGNDAVGGRGQSDEYFGSGRDGADRLDAGDGDDALLGSGWPDSYIGGPGTDRAHFRNVHVDLGKQTVTGPDGAPLGTIVEVEGVSAEGASRVIGDDGPNFIHVLGGIARGAGGDDFILGSFADDVLIGGRGDDDIRAHSGRDVVRGSAGDDVIQGWTKADELFGGSGNDSIFGGDHDDLLKGGRGVDTLDGEEGIDKCRGGETYRSCERRRR